MKNQVKGIVLFVSFILIVSTTLENQIIKTRKGTISISSDAPLEIIKASSQALKGVIDTDKNTFAFSISNRSIVGFNSPLQQEHFYENYIEAQKYPKSSFEGKIIEQINFAKDGDYTVRAKGILNIHGVEKERIIKSTLRIKNGIFFVSSQFTILLSEHNITIPKVVYQKIAEEITIKVDAEFIATNDLKK
jgi:polyisoprenoid-binding protein YceI